MVIVCSEMQWSTCSFDGSTTIKVSRASSWENVKRGWARRLLEQSRIFPAQFLPSAWVEGTKRNPEVRHLCKICRAMLNKRTRLHGAEFVQLFRGQERELRSGGSCFHNQGGLG